MAKKEAITNKIIKPKKKTGKSKKHPNKHQSVKPYKGQGK